MQRRKLGTKITLTGATLLLASPFLMASASAETSTARTLHHHVATTQAHGVTKSHSVVYSSHAVGRHGRYVHATRSYGISCVPFARAESGIVVAGNAWQWWDNAAGTYARGQTPEPGSVLAFRANGRMRLGHVAVIARVVNAREVLIDHANWPSAGMRGGVSQAIPVVDVSENNDWTAVRVGLGRGGDFGSVYPTYGFIYDRPDTGTVEARRHAPAEQVADLNPAPRDLRHVTLRPTRKFEEVAELPRHPRRHAVLIMPRTSESSAE
jgi:surface antigen